jgi:hypothetical protein
LNAPDQRQPDIWATHLSRTRALYSPSAQIAAQARADGREPPSGHIIPPRAHPDRIPPQPPMRHRPADGPPTATMGSPGSPVGHPLAPNATISSGGMAVATAVNPHHPPGGPNVGGGGATAINNTLPADLSSDGPAISDPGDDKDDITTPMSHSSSTSMGAVVTPPSSSSSSGPPVLNGVGSGAGRKGAYLAQSDLERISAFVTEFTLTALLPAIEQKLAALYEKVH